MAEQQGFLAQLGVGAQDEDAILKAKQQQMLSGAAAQREVERERASVGLAGIMGGIGGLFRGGGLKDRLGSAGRGAAQAATQQTEHLAAQAAGITRQQMLGRKEMRRASADIPQDGSIDSQIKLAKAVAAIASKHGDTEVLGNALAKVAALETEQQEFNKLKAEVTSEEREVAEDIEVGKTGRNVQDATGTINKYVRINEGPNMGKYWEIRADGSRNLVEGAEVVFQDDEETYSAAKDPARQNTLDLMKIVEKNGAGTGGIVKMRAELDALAGNAQIVSNISDLLNAMSDPQAIMDLSGKAAIFGDKTAALIESFAAIYGGREGPTDIGWEDENGKLVQKMSASEQKAKFMEKGNSELLDTLNELAGSAHETLDMFVPSGLRGNALAAEQYWANVMELAYLDARLQEPSNRGLSDNDIKNALMRVGAHTANPLSFAKRQLEVIDTKLIPAIQTMGTEFTNFQHPTISLEEVKDAIYPSELRAEIELKLLEARKDVLKVLAGGRRGERRQTEGEGETPQTLDDIDLKIAELQEWLDKQQSGTTEEPEE